MDRKRGSMAVHRLTFVMLQAQILRDEMEADRQDLYWKIPITESAHLRDKMNNRIVFLNKRIILLDKMYEFTKELRSDL